MRSRRAAQCSRLAIAAAAAIVATAVGAESEPSLAYVGVRLETPGTAPRDGMTIVIRDGVIVAVGEAATIEVPFDAKVVDAAGLHAVPAFVDAHCEAFSAELPKDESPRRREIDEGVTIHMDPLARTGRTPEARVRLALPLEGAARWREAGFAAVLAVPKGTGMRGRSAVTWLLDSPLAESQLLLARDVFQHLDLRIAGAGYPSTLMGTLAALRQYFLDAGHDEALWARYERQGRKVERPPLDESLRALAPLVRGEQALVIGAAGKRDIRVALSFAAELGVKAVIAGGAEADEIAPELAAAAGLILALDFPRAEGDAEGAAGSEPGHRADASICDDCMAGAHALQDPAVAPPETDEPAPVETEPAEPQGEAKGSKPRGERPARIEAEREAQRKKRIAAAGQLAAAGVPFALTAHELDSPSTFRKNLALAIAEGLPREVALAALTAEPARLLGLGDVLGDVAPGRLAAIAIFDGDPLADGSALRHLVVGRERFEIEAKPKAKEGGRRGRGGAEPTAAAIDLTGTWRLEVELGGGTREYTLSLEQRDGRLSGGAQASSGGGEVAGGSVQGDAVDFTTVFQFGDRGYEFVYTGKVSGDTMAGTVSINGGEGYPWSGERQGKPQGGAK
jgi:imidazolonepropionase-like amidohydrolase